MNLAEGKAEESEIIQGGYLAMNKKQLSSKHLIVIEL
jgi:hypothetical protein